MIEKYSSIIKGKNSIIPIFNAVGVYGHGKEEETMEILDDRMKQANNFHNKIGIK